MPGIEIGTRNLKGTFACLFIFMLKDRCGISHGLNVAPWLLEFQTEDDPVGLIGLAA
jgi:hypothetical protein